MAGIIEEACVPVCKFNRKREQRMKGVGVGERKSLAKNVIQRVIKEKEHGAGQVHLRRVGWIKALPGDGLCEQGFNQPQLISAHTTTKWKYF